MHIRMGKVVRHIRWISFHRASNPCIVGATRWLPNPLGMRILACRCMYR
jgi:hypothetical protein